jgi:AraC family transcriptional regulator
MIEPNIPEESFSKEDKFVQGTSRLIDGFPSGQRLAFHRVDAAALTSVVSDYARDDSRSGVWHSADTHFLDFSLSGRPEGAWGHFPDAFADPERVGKMLFIPAGHRYAGRGGIGRQRDIALFLRSSRRFDDESVFGKEMRPVLRHCVHLHSSRVVDLMLRVGRETRRPGIASEVILEGLSLTLLGEIARVLHNCRLGNAYKGGLAVRRLRLIEERVRDEGAQPTITELATLCGMSRRHLFRAFHQQTGQTIGKFVQQIMIERARLLLSESDDPIKTVAAKLGFSSPTAFATAFRRTCGLSPRQFRTHCTTASIQ